MASPHSFDFPARPSLPLGGGGAKRRKGPPRRHHPCRHAAVPDLGGANASEAGTICRNRSVIQRSLPPLPPSYEEGALRRGRARFVGTFPMSQPLLPLPPGGVPERSDGQGGGVYFTACVIRRRGRRPRRPAYRKLTRPEHRRTGRISAPRAAAARRLRS